MQLAIDGRDKIIASDSTETYKDLSKLWDTQLSFTIQKITGNIDYKDTNQ
jgi:hypothetical protein